MFHQRFKIIGLHRPIVLNTLYVLHTPQIRREKLDLLYLTSVMRPWTELWPVFFLVGWVNLDESQ